MDRNSKWHCKDGTVVRIRDMEDSHIQNSIRMIKNSHGWRTSYLPILEAELKHRTEIAKSPLMAALK